MKPSLAKTETHRGAVDAESQLVHVALLDFLCAVLVRAVDVFAHAGLQQVAADGHARRIKLVQEAAGLPFHAQSAQPVGAHRLHVVWVVRDGVGPGLAFREGECRARVPTQPRLGTQAHGIPVGSCVDAPCPAFPRHCRITPRPAAAPDAAAGPATAQSRTRSRPSQQRERRQTCITRFTSPPCRQNNIIEQHASCNRAGKRRIYHVSPVRMEWMCPDTALSGPLDCHVPRDPAGQKGPRHATTASKNRRTTHSHDM